jgi:hypothetical protein
MPDPEPWFTEEELAVIAEKALAIHNRTAETAEQRQARLLRDGFRPFMP